MHDLVRPVQTAAEFTFFVHLLSEFSNRSNVDYSHIIVEYNKGLCKLP